MSTTQNETLSEVSLSMPGLHAVELVEGEVLEVVVVVDLVEDHAADRVCSVVSMSTPRWKVPEPFVS